MSGITISADEVNRMLKEILKYTVLGLCESEAANKQFYLERIFLEMGLSLLDIRNKLGVEVGVMPEDAMDGAK